MIRQRNYWRGHLLSCCHWQVKLATWLFHISGFRCRMSSTMVFTCPFVCRGPTWLVKDGLSNSNNIICTRICWGLDPWCLPYPSTWTVPPVTVEIVINQPSFSFKCPQSLLPGSIPPQLGDLDALEELYLHNSKFSGTSWANRQTVDVFAPIHPSYCFESIHGGGVWGCMLLMRQKTTAKPEDVNAFIKPTSFRQKK